MNKKIFYISILIGQLSFAQNSRQTIGDLLNQAGSNKKSETALPSTGFGFNQPNQQQDVSKIKPPKTADVLQNDNTDRSAYNQILDRQIKELFKLTQKMKNSPTRGEIWLRLAETYVEKSRLIEQIKQDEYDQKLVEFQKGKTKEKPQLDISAAQEYNRRAIELYEWFERDFPKDPKTPQALFFLGYNHFELGNSEKAVSYFDKLTKIYPSSPFSLDAHFSLAEFYFENDRYQEALTEYTFLHKYPKHRMYIFSIYKAAWCLFRVNREAEALQQMEKIVAMSRVNANTEANKSKIEQEAIRDIVFFYSEVKKVEEAIPYFKNLAGQDWFKYIEKLAYFYSDKGLKSEARYLFKQLIQQNPKYVKNFDYQYQIVQNYFFDKNNDQFKAELYIWVTDYAPGSAWNKDNATNAELMEKSDRLRETTLRNYALQQHQTAQNSRAEFSQKTANDAYLLYFQKFPTHANVADMHFYYGELLYDMTRFSESAKQYQWVVENAQQNQFYSKAGQNWIISIEKSIPTDSDIQKMTAQKSEIISLSQGMINFIKNAESYFVKFPKSEKEVDLKFRIARIYYLHNQFDPALKYFNDIVKNYPNNKYTEPSANLILDIYNLKKDYVGLEKSANDLLQIQAVASTRTGQDIRGVIEKANFKKAQDKEQNQKYGEAAEGYMLFANQYPQSNLVVQAWYNAGINFERDKQPAKAAQAYEKVLQSNLKEADAFKPKVKKFMAKINQDSGNLSGAADNYMQLAKENMKDPLALNYLFNAAVIYESLGKTEQSSQAYTQYLQLQTQPKEKAEAYFALAQQLRKSKLLSKAYQNYEQAIKLNMLSPDKHIEALYWLAESNMTSKKTADYNLYKNMLYGFHAKKTTDGKNPGAQWIAKLKLRDAFEILQQLKAIKFGESPQSQKAAADKKIALLSTLNKAVTEVIKYDAAEEIVSSLAYLGDGNKNLGDGIVTAPMPKDLNAEVMKQYKAGIQQIADPFYQKAKEAFKASIERSSSLNAYTDYSDYALKVMATWEPKNYYYGSEKIIDHKQIQWMVNK